MALSVHRNRILDHRLQLKPVGHAALVRTC
jgi:hypothetical protein